MRFLFQYLWETVERRLDSNSHLHLQSMSFYFLHFTSNWLVYLRIPIFVFDRCEVNLKIKFSNFPLIPFLCFEWLTSCFLCSLWASYSRRRNRRPLTACFATYLCFSLSNRSFEEEIESMLNKYKLINY